MYARAVVLLSIVIH